MHPVAAAVGLEGGLRLARVCHPHQRQEQLTLQLMAPCTSSLGLICVPEVSHVMTEKPVSGAGH